MCLLVPGKGVGLGRKGERLIPSPLCVCVCSSEQVLKSSEDNSEPRGSEGGEGVSREGEERDGTMTVEDVLSQLNLDSLIDTFHKEQIDFDSLVSRVRALGNSNKATSF